MLLKSLLRVTDIIKTNTMLKIPLWKVQDVNCILLNSSSPSFVSTKRWTSGHTARDEDGWHRRHFLSILFPEVWSEATQASTVLLFQPHSANNCASFVICLRLYHTGRLRGEDVLCHNHFTSIFRISTFAIRKHPAHIWIRSFAQWDIYLYRYTVDLYF